MNTQEKSIALLTFMIADIKRVFRMWTQTFLAPAINSFLYFVVFGSVMGFQIGEMGGHPYVQFIAPGLIIMSLITSAYNHTGFAFYLGRFQRSIEELLISPMPNWLILLGYVLGGVMRGLIVGVIITAVALI